MHFNLHVQLFLMQVWRSESVAKVKVFARNALCIAVANTAAESH